MKITYLICACALVFATACNEPTTENAAESTDVKTEAPAEKEKSTEVRVSPNGGSLKTDDIEIEINK